MRDVGRETLGGRNQGRIFENCPNSKQRMVVSSLLAEELSLSPSSPYEPEEFSKLVDQVLEQHDLEDSRDLAHWFVRMFLRMAVHTYQRLCEPAPEVPAELFQEFLLLRETAPVALPDFCQSCVDPASALRRALTIHQRLQGQGRVLLLGDDDGVGVALSLLGDYALTVADLDPRILDWSKSCSRCPIETCEMDVRRVPEAMRGVFDALSTDPIRDSSGKCFLEAAAQCLKEGGWLFWADHPDWNQHCQSWLDATEGIFEHLETHHNWHSYSATLPAELRAEFEADEDSQRFLRLSEQIRLWSNLYVLRQRPAKGVSAQKSKSR